MATAAEIRGQLNSVWAMFRAVGIADDLQIIEHIAALLAGQEKLQPPHDDLRPQLPRSGVIDLNALRVILRSLSNDVGSTAELFDRYVLFRLSGRLPGERYPTPRHIVRFMHAVAEVAASHALGDFACGSGGTLALRPMPTDEGVVTFGSEIAPVWARLAWTNCALHGITNPQINIGNALDLDLASQHYDRVVMNPPFGGQAARRSAKSQAGRSETAFANLALDVLNERGRACVLTPSGMLFGSGAELALRKKLVDDYTLDAIISLPKDAFQPFSSIQTHLLLATRAMPGDEYATWFLRAERDGYKSGIGRDLTEELTPEALANSDLPLLEVVLAQHGQPWEIQYPDEAPLIGIKRYATAESRDVLVLGASESATLGRVERYDGGNLRVLLVNVIVGEQSMLLAINPVSGPPREVTKTREQEVSDTLGVAQKDLPPAVLLHREENNGSAIAIAPDGRLLGTLVARRKLIERGYDLRPESYAQAEEQRGPLKPPGELLAGIRANQRRLIRRIDGLLGRLEMPPIGDGNMLAPVWEMDGLEPLLKLLSDEQRTVWEIVRQITVEVESVDAQYPTPRHFTAETLLDRDLPDAVVETTLDLLERMGLIVQVNVLEQPDQPRVAAYRLVSRLDRWVIETVEDARAIS